ncbi:MAG: PKD domain-containing protein [Saprospiraceae bacterium]
MLVFAFTVSASAFAQLKHDNTWTIGYGQIWPSSDGYPFGGVIMDFSTAPPTFSLLAYIFDRPKATISDKNGQLVAYTNGCMIVNRDHELMVNGDTLNPGDVFNGFCENGDYPLWQPTIFLPKPGSDSLYYLFHIRSDDEFWSPINLMYSILDASGDEGGVVVSKNNSALSDSLFLGRYVTATRHGNGLDWWVVTPRRFSNGIHVSLLSTEGVEYKGIQDVTSRIDSAFWGSQTAFSQDGSKYFRNSTNGLLMLDFDRCDGILSNPVYLDWDSIPFGGRGVATSPNSRFLYLTSGGTVQQYDLWAADLAASMQVVAAYDGFLAPYPATFFQMMPGPDGKIYIITTYDNNVLHVIHNPNEPGLACKVEQHAYTLPARTSFFIPNFANYNLGPIDGAPCDTLGINNLPVARFRWNVADTLSPQQVAFTDYSYHEPTAWLWDFGDGTTSQDTSPVHLYASPGIYTVCLTVCNANACDTVCQEVEVEVVGTVTLQGEGGQVLLSPNPASDVLRIQFEVPLKGEVVITDLSGRTVQVLSMSEESKVLDVPVAHLSNGVYVLAFADVSGKLPTNAKFVVLR